VRKHTVGEYENDSLQGKSNSRNMLALRLISHNSLDLKNPNWYGSSSGG
jgi:hypothetical protein